MYNEIQLIKKDKEGNETQEVVKFRLQSRECVELEKEIGKPIQNYLEENESITAVVKIIKYMRRWENMNFNDHDAEKLYDLLVENGWTFKKILQDVVYETLVVSGFLEKQDWEEMKKLSEEAAKKLKDKRKSIIANI